MIHETRFFVGMDAPAHLFLGQIEQESRCEEGVTAFDGGAGLGQFMPATAEWLHERERALREISTEPSPYDPRWSIRAVILYDDWLYGVVVCKEWLYAFRAYNGGAALLNKEIERAGTCDTRAVETACRRKVLILKSGKKLDLCAVNIDYPRRIAARGEKYR